MLDFWELLASWGFRKELIELEPRERDEEAAPQDPYRGVEHTPNKVFTVGAWAGSAALANPERAVNFAKSISLGRLDIIVNDHSKSRSPRPFDIRDPQRIATLAKMAQDAGLEVHIMSWIMPHLGYLKSAADILFDLHEKIGFKSVMWDAEEPWALAKNHMGYQEAGEWLRQAFQGRDFDMGVTGIRYASRRKLKPLTDVCDYWTPQNYATSSSKADPATVNARGIASWEKRFGRPPKWVLGIAGYRQMGIKGHTPESAITACLSAAAKHCEEVVIWSLPALRRSPEVAEAVRAYLSRPEVADRQA